MCVDKHEVTAAVSVGTILWVSALRTTRDFMASRKTAFPDKVSSYSHFDPENRWMLNIQSPHAVVGWCLWHVQSNRA